MKKTLSHITIIVLGITLGYAGIASAASLDVIGWGFSTMPTASNTYNQDYNQYAPSMVNNGNVGQGAGWISLTSQNHQGPSPSYGVKVDDTTGNFSQYAWNPNLGYVNFSGARVNPACFSDQSGSYPVTGTITFLSASQPQAGGWNGVVQMSGNWNNSVTVDCSTGNLSGYGWGDYVVGWVDFKWAKINMVPPEPPVCPDDEYEHNGECYDNRCIAKDGSFDFMYYDDGDPVPQVCQDPVTPVCTDPTLCPNTGPAPIYKEN